MGNLTVVLCLATMRPADGFLGSRDAYVRRKGTLFSNAFVAPLRALLATELARRAERGALV
jgi:hypothetical protein